MPPEKQPTPPLTDEGLDPLWRQVGEHGFGGRPWLWVLVLLALILATLCVLVFLATVGLPGPGVD